MIVAGGIAEAIIIPSEGAVLAFNWHMTTSAENYMVSHFYSF